jgi:hypothetical protein
MAATFTWEGNDQTGTDTIGTGPTPFDIGGSGSSINFTQARNWSTSIASSPIPAGQASIERNIRGKFTGSFSSITTVKFWRSDANSLATGVTISAGGLADTLGVAWTVPSVTANADAAIPTSEPGSLNVAVDASGSTRYAPALSGGSPRWIRLQVHTTGSTPAGDIAGSTPHFQVTMKYTES